MKLKLKSKQAGNVVIAGVVIVIVPIVFGIGLGLIFYELNKPKPPAWQGPPAPEWVAQSPLRKGGS